MHYVIRGTVCAVVNVPEYVYFSVSWKTMWPLKSLISLSKCGPRGGLGSHNAWLCTCTESGIDLREELIWIYLFRHAYGNLIMQLKILAQSYILSVEIQKQEHSHEHMFRLQIKLLWKLKTDVFGICQCFLKHHFFFNSSTGPDRCQIIKLSDRQNNRLLNRS